MDRVVKCPICGQEFATNKPREKYCVNCKEEASKRTRDSWKIRSGYNEKQRNAIREKRAKELEIKTGITQAMKQAEYDARLKAEQERMEKNHRELVEAAKNGDALANMQLSRGWEDSNYWKWYKQYEIENMNVNIDSIVNGISIFESDFESKVIESIKCDGRILREVIYKK